MKKSRKYILPTSLVLLLVIAGMFYMKSIVSHADTIPSDSIKSQLETMYNGKVSDMLLNGDIYGATLTRGGSVYSVRVDGETGKVLSMILKKPSSELVSKQKKAAEKEKEDELSIDKTEETPDEPKQEEPKQQPEAPKPAPEKPKPQPKPDPSPKPTPKPQQQEQQNQNQYHNHNHNHQNNYHEKKKEQQNTVIISEQQAIRIALSQLKGEVDDVDFVKTSEGGYYLVEIEIDVDDGPDEATYQIHAISGKIMSVTWDD